MNLDLFYLKKEKQFSCAPKGTTPLPPFKEKRRQQTPKISHDLRLNCLFRI